LISDAIVIDELIDDQTYSAAAEAEAGSGSRITTFCNACLKSIVGVMEITKLRDDIVGNVCDLSHTAPFSKMAAINTTHTVYQIPHFRVKECNGDIKNVLG